MTLIGGGSGGCIFAEKGERGILEMRKHLGWYVRGLPDAKRLRQKLVMVKSVKQIRKILSA